MHLWKVERNQELVQLTVCGQLSTVADYLFREESQRGGELAVNTYEFDVAVSTHDLVKQGIIACRFIRVLVAADSYTEAELIATQMAGCHGMPTAVFVRI